MKRSEPFSTFAKAFAAFQLEVKNPKMTADNPHLKSKYAPLSEVLNTVRPVLAKHGLSVYQDVSSQEEKIIVTTTLYHESGEYLESSPLYIPAGRGGKPADAQGFGSAASYAKRYQLQAVVGVAADEDSDGEDLGGATPMYVPMNMVGQPSKETLAAKYQLGTGKREGFEEYYDEMTAQGKDHKYIDGALNKALEKKKQPQVS